MVCGSPRDMRSPHPCFINRALLRLVHDNPHISKWRFNFLRLHNIDFS